MQTKTLVRKSFYISPGNVAKLESLTKKLKESSAAKIVRDAIDAYDPDSSKMNIEDEDLFKLAHERVKKAIKATKRANEKMDHCLNTLSKRKE